MRRESQDARERAVARNKKVYHRTHQAIVDAATTEQNFFSRQFLGYLDSPMEMRDFGALRANSRTHKRNNIRSCHRR